MVCVCVGGAGDRQTGTGRRRRRRCTGAFAFPPRVSELVVDANLGGVCCGLCRPRILRILCVRAWLHGCQCYRQEPPLLQRSRQPAWLPQPGQTTTKNTHRSPSCSAPAGQHHASRPVASTCALAYLDAACLVRCRRLPCRAVPHSISARIRRELNLVFTNRPLLPLSPPPKPPPPVALSCSDNHRSFLAGIPIAISRCYRPPEWVGAGLCGCHHRLPTPAPPLRPQLCFVLAHAHSLSLSLSPHSHIHIPQIGLPVGFEFVEPAPAESYEVCMLRPPPPPPPSAPQITPPPALAPPS